MAFPQQVSGAARTVLVVEDDAAVRTTLRLILERFGYSVTEAGDGEEALDLLDGGSVSVILLDLAMPRLDGFSLLERLDVPPPVVVVHSAFEYFTEDEARTRGGTKIFRCLRKPCPPETLVDTVAQAVDKWLELTDS